MSIAATMDKVFDVIETGVVKTAATASQLADVPCRKVKFKTLSGNSNVVYIGNSGVTVPSGTPDATTGFPMAASQESDWIPVSNLNQIYVIGGTPNDWLYYMAVE